MRTNHEVLKLSLQQADGYVYGRPEAFEAGQHCWM